MSWEDEARRYKTNADYWFRMTDNLGRACSEMCTALQGFFIDHDPRLTKYAKISVALDQIVRAGSLVDTGKVISVDEKMWRLTYAPSADDHKVIKIVLWVRASILSAAIEYAEGMLPECGWILEGAEHKIYREV